MKKLHDYVFWMKHRKPTRVRDNIFHFLARVLIPKRLKYWCYIVVAAHGTTGIYSNQVVSDLCVLEALRRYAKDNKL